MDQTPSPPATDVGDDAEATPEGDYVRVSRAALTALYARAEAAVLPAGGGPPDSPRPPQRDPVPDGDAGRPLEATAEVLGRSERLAQDVADRDRRLADLERAYKAAVRERELATALSGRPLVAGAAAQLIKLWRDEFEVEGEEGDLRVRSRDGRGVGTAVNDWLARPEYSHFCLPSSRGGSGARDANRPSAGVAPPKNLGEAVLIRWREESAARPQGLLKPVGLRRHR